MDLFNRKKLMQYEMKYAEVKQKLDIKEQELNKQKEEYKELQEKYNISTHNKNIKRKTNMTYYLAIDYKAYHEPTWRFLKLLKGLYEKELNLREVRNYAITMMKKDSMIWCINILKRVKGEYIGVERVMPDGITNVDDVRDGWGFIGENEIEEHVIHENY